MGIEPSTTGEQDRRLGRYRLLHMLGRGGMGEVWLAEDSQLHRQVALKLLVAALASEGHYLQTFRYEARAVAALDHPHILPVHDFGEERGVDSEITPYLVMPYIPGGTLRNRIYATRGLLPTREAMRYLSQAARAIDHAHSRQVLHRDIKPANMLLQDDWLLLADFGIAKLLTTVTYRSKTHAGAGTPAYMAPEQIQKKAEAASDRYSLGIVAYQLFTGQVPFTGETPVGVLVKQVQQEPPPPRRFNPALPQGVEEALLQAIAKRPQDRPGSCAALIEALARGWKLGALAEVDPDETIPVSGNKRGREREKRQASFPGLWSSAHEADIAQPLAPAQPVPMPAMPIAPTVEVSFNQREAAPQQTQPVPEKPPAPKSILGRRALLIGGAAAVAAIAGGTVLATLLHPGSTIQTTATPTPLPGAEPTGTPGPLQLRPGIPVLSLTGHSSYVYVAAWDPSGRYLATGGKDTRVMLWDIATALSSKTTTFSTLPTPQRSWSFLYPITDNQLCWSADGRTIATSPLSPVQLIDPFRSGSQMQSYDDPTLNKFDVWQTNRMAWQPQSDVFAVLISFLIEDVFIGLWRRGQPGKAIKTLTYPGPQFVSADTVSWSPDGNLLATVLANTSTDVTIGDTSTHNQIVIWYAATGEVKQTFILPAAKEVEPQSRTPIAWSPVEPHLLALGNLNNAVIWDIQQNVSILTLTSSDTQHDPSHSAINLYALAWSPNGRYLAGCYGHSPRIYIWDVQTLRRTARPGSVQTQTLYFPPHNGAGHSQPVNNIAWSPDGRYIASTSFDKTVIVWRVSAP